MSFSVKNGYCIMKSATSFSISLRVVPSPGYIDILRQKRYNIIIQEDADMEENGQKSNKILIAVMVLVITLILVLSGVVGLALFGNTLGVHLFEQQETTSPETEPVTTERITTAPVTTEPRWKVPDVVGMHANNAYTALHHAGTRFEIKREYSAEVAAEYVISQTPEPGTIIRDSEKVQLIISKGVDRKDDKSSSSRKPKATEPTTKTSSSNDYILKDSDKRYVSFNEVRALSKKEKTLALNEIYARHGRKFDSSELQSYFNSKSWYKGTIAPSDFKESSLNQYESANVQTILSAM